MRITVNWTPRRDGLPDEQEVRLGKGTTSTINDLLDQLAEPHEGVLAVREGKVVPLDAPLHDGEKILLVRTISGG